VGDAEPEMGIAEISGGRKLRHNARGRIERLFAAEVWDVFEWNYFDFVDIEFSDGGVRYGKRLAVHLIFADVHGDCLVSQEIAERFTGDLQKAIAESKAFAIGAYADALMAGDALPVAKRTEIAAKLSRLTEFRGIYDRADLRIEIQRFDKELMKNERRTVGRLDGRLLESMRTRRGSSRITIRAWRRLSGRTQRH